MPEAPGAPPPTLGEALGWIGFDVDDAGGAWVGRVRAVFADTESGEPAWLVVALGRRRSKLVAVPVRNCAAGAGRVWTAFERDTLRTAPMVDATRPLLREHELTICVHYGIGGGLGRGAEALRLPKGSVASQPAA